MRATPFRFGNVIIKVHKKSMFFFDFSDIFEDLESSCTFSPGEFLVIFQDPSKDRSSILFSQSSNERIFDRYISSRLSIFVISGSGRVQFINHLNCIAMSDEIESQR